MREGQVFNPYLPGNEYIPDGEPYIFGDRVYVYGSHDKYNGVLFCWNDYVCYSAPINDLSSWKYEGVIYRKKQDPSSKLGTRLLFAPDVSRGKDGCYYLYYALDFLGKMGVAVCDTPAGTFQFLGHIKYANGVIWGRKKGDDFPFDPSVFIDDDGRIYLYSGFGIDIPAIATQGVKLKNRGGIVLELEDDMLTIKEEAKLLFPLQGEGAFENHEFFEASSMRKINNRYYFVYSSRHNHELCYAVGDSPTGQFTYGGTLISLGDLFLEGNEDETKGVNYLGNTHGGMVNLNEKWYIFYHRHTNRHSYSRQAMAESLVMTAEGHFLQSETTSCGLNNGALLGEGIYEARIACNLWSKQGTGRYDVKWSRFRYKKHPYFKQDGKDGKASSVQYIANMQDGATVGYKYFNFVGLSKMYLHIRGRAEGELQLSTDSAFRNIVGKTMVKVASKAMWIQEEVVCVSIEGEYAFYIRFIGKGYIDLLNFEFIK